MGLIYVGLSTSFQIALQDPIVFGISQLFEVLLP